MEMPRTEVEVLVCALLGVDSLVLKCNGIMEEAPRFAQPFFFSLQIIQARRDRVLSKPSTTRLARGSGWDRILLC